MDIFSSPSRPNNLCGPASLCYRARRLGTLSPDHIAASTGFSPWPPDTAPAGGRPPYHYTRHPVRVCDASRRGSGKLHGATAEGPAYVLGEGVSVPAPAAYAGSSGRAAVHALGAS
uniref:Uncharacterized protein n=1 Tax=Oryza meridionalis TaxID=40149 RepID=A0A0E0CQK3_9ORYZ